MNDQVIVRTAKGHYHLAALVDGRRMVDEACNLDDAPGDESLVSAAELEAADPGTLCGRCFRRSEGDA